MANNIRHVYEPDFYTAEPSYQDICLIVRFTNPSIMYG